MMFHFAFYIYSGDVIIIYIACVDTTKYKIKHKFTNKNSKLNGSPFILAAFALLFPDFCVFFFFLALNLIMLWVRYLMLLSTIIYLFKF